MARGLAARKLTWLWILDLGIGMLFGATALAQQPPNPPPLPTPPPGAFQPVAPPTSPPAGAFQPVAPPTSPPAGAYQPVAPPTTPPAGAYQPVAPPTTPPAGAYQPVAPRQPVLPPTGYKPNPQPSAPLAAVQPHNPLDQPLQWLVDAHRNYSLVRDYTCTLRKQERVSGILQEENIMSLSFREKPFSLHMKWMFPAKSANQEVIYVQGQNAGNMLVKIRGPLGGTLLGWQHVSPNDPRVFQHSRHTITETGIGNMIDQLIRHMNAEKLANKTIVKTDEYKFDDRVCIRLETIRPQRQEGFHSYRTVVYLDKASKYPIRLENYDWPVPGGPQDGELLEKFSYYGLRFNVGLTDEVFRR